MLQFGPPNSVSAKLRSLQQLRTNFPQLIDQYQDVYEYLHSHQTHVRTCRRKTSLVNHNRSRYSTTADNSCGGHPTLRRRTLTDTFTLTVTPVNDAPSFTIGPNQTVSEDAGFQFVSGWVTNMSAGPNESDEWSFQVTNNTNPGLFVQQPSVEINGLLHYMLVSNVTGSADITIIMKDNGGTANGGVDTSALQTFTITVTPEILPLSLGMASTTKR